MTTSLEAMKAAREALGRSLLRLRGPGDRDYAEACDYALTLLDAAIKREDGQPPSGVVSREEAIQDVAKRAWVSGYEQGHHDTVETGYYDPASQWDDDEQLRSDVLGAVPSEPMVPRARAMEAVKAGLREQRHYFGRDLDSQAARILDGEASDGE